ESMLGSLAAVELPAQPGPRPVPLADQDPLHLLLFERYRIEVPVYGWPGAARRWIRVSPHLHNSDAQYVFLAEALRGTLRQGAAASWAPRPGARPCLGMAGVLAGGGGSVKVARRMAGPDTALLLIDLQRNILAGKGGPEALAALERTVERAAGLLDRARRR